MELHNTEYPLVWAHRGRNQDAPENTIAAFRAALEAGDAGIELDVTLSQDGKLVVIHDDTLERTTNGTGAVASMTLKQLRKLDAGSWFHPDFRNEKLPQLDELLQEFGNKLLMNIEIKSSAWREKLVDSIEPLVLERIAQMGCGDSVLISSFDPRILKRVRQLDSNIPIGALAQAGKNPSIVVDFAEGIGAYSIHPDGVDLIEGLPEQYSGFTGKLFPYTVKSQSFAETLLSVGVHGYFADLPYPSSTGVSE